MKLAVLGAGGGPGRNAVDAALAAGHAVVALVRDPRRAQRLDQRSPGTARIRISACRAEVRGSRTCHLATTCDSMTRISSIPGHAGKIPA
jgi:nucleoside-diphosphate-sugar epimerase